MRLAETVTFGGSGLNRAAEHRRDGAQIAAMWAVGKVLLLWRGKPLMQDGALAWLPASHPLAGQVQTALFLGMDEQPAFAQDISAWQPVEPAPGEAGFFDTSVQGHPDLPEAQMFHELRAVMAALTPRESEVLRLIGRGLRSGEAAKVMGVAEQTVAGYVKAIYRKLNICSRAEAALEAARRGLV